MYHFHHFVKRGSSLIVLLRKTAHSRNIIIIYQKSRISLNTCIYMYIRTRTRSKSVEAEKQSQSSFGKTQERDIQKKKERRKKRQNDNPARLGSPSIRFCRRSRLDTVRRRRRRRRLARAREEYRVTRARDAAGKRSCISSESATNRVT